MEEQRSISSLSIVELKALAYDELAKLEAAQNNIRVINTELQKRRSEQNGKLTEDVNSTEKS